MPTVYARSFKLSPAANLLSLCSLWCAEVVSKRAEAVSKRAEASDIAKCEVGPAVSKHTEASDTAKCGVVLVVSKRMGMSEVSRCAAGLVILMPVEGLEVPTVVKDIAQTVRDMAGGSEYREKLGVVRLAIGQSQNEMVEKQRIKIEKKAK